MRDRLATDAHLWLDVWGVVYVRDHETGEDRWLGWIDYPPEWPEGLGPEPKWLLTEWAFLADYWAEAERFAEGCRAAAKARW